MKAQEWTLTDKSKWPERGPWDNEPDKAQWQDPATGLPCLAVRAHSHWCGYVGVPEGHPAFCQDYDNVDVSAHGGLTFSGKCQPGTDEPRVCHIVEPGEPDNVWWLGFDCAHSGDKRPAQTAREHAINLEFPHDPEWEQYRTLDYVREQCTELAAQLMSGKITGHAHGDEGGEDGSASR